MPYRVIFVIILTIVTASINAEVKKEIRALKTSGTIRIDGYLDEGDWSETQVIDDFIQQYPNEGLSLSERTEVRLLYDTDKLFTQWNHTDDRASTNFLLNYIYRPGSDFYLVYNQIWDTSEGIHTNEWTILSKFTLLLSI